MTTSSEPGPRSFIGLFPPQQGPTPYVGGPAAIGIPENPDFGPSLTWAGMGLREPRYLPRIGEGPLSAGGYAAQDMGWYGGGPWVCIDQAPAALGTTNIVNAVAPVANTALTLQGASTGITVLANPLTIPSTGKVVPAGCLVIDANTNYVGAGQSDAFQFLDPTQSIARAISITALSGASANNITIRGYDLYGNPMTQTKALTAASTVNTAKAFKYVQSVTPSVTDAGHALSIGTSDIFGFPLRVDTFAYLDLYWNDIRQLVATFTAAVTSAPSVSTGDTRGTFTNSGSASNGTIKLQVFIRASVANLVSPSSYATYVTGLLGPTQV